MSSLRRNKLKEANNFLWCFKTIKANVIEEKLIGTRELGLGIGLGLHQVRDVRDEVGL